MLDSIRRVTTPELVEIYLRPAGFLARGLAFFIDLTLRAILIIFIYALLSDLDQFGTGLWLLSLFIIEWFYPVLCEIYCNGATPGKKALGLRVIHDNGTPVGWSASITRNLLRTADFLPFGYAFGLFSMLFHSEFKRLGDIAAGTLVVYSRSTLNAIVIADEVPIPPAVKLTAEDQQTIVSFAEKAPTLTPTRQEELANLVPWLSHSSLTPDESGAKRLMGIANFLIGRKV